MESIADTEVYPGQILGGKFRIEEILGRGGMGIVVAATHLQLDEKVALKFLLPEALANKEAVRRFEREARAAVKIKSEHVARVTDVGTLDTGAPYMVMEFLNGMDLGDYLSQQGQLTFEEAADCLLQACEAIAEAHSLGIVHRDLKPANLFRITRSDGTPSIKVLDFGISKVTTGSDASMTQTSSMMGSPYYMSPEQMTSAKNVDHRTDIWALGVILHELLTGKVPYQGETIPEICVQVLQNPPPRLTELRPDAPRDLEAIIERALAKNRDERYATVADFAADISAYASAPAAHSVERISKVLGVTASKRSPHTYLKPASGIDATMAHRSVAIPAPALDAASTSESLTMTTLGGAAHEQPDYAPPTTSNRAPWIIAAAVLLLGGGALAMVSSGEDDATLQEPVIAATGSETPGPQKEPEPEGQTEEQPQQQPSEEVHGEQDVATAKAPIAAKAPAPVKAPAKATVVKKPKTTTTQPVAKPQVEKAPAPAPRPAPQPKPSASSLYLDRK